DDFVVMASEAGALSIPVSNIRAKGRLEPGQILVVNTTQGRILDDEAIKMELASVRPSRRWVAEHRVDLSDLIAKQGVVGAGESSLPLTVRQRAFGYTADEVKMVLGPMADAGEEPAGSMGNDTPLAVLSSRPQLLSAYFRQMFAQVTNPAIDPIREQLVMSLSMNLGPQCNVLEETAEHAKQIRITQPVLTEESVSALRSVTDPTLRAVTLSALFPVADGARGLEWSVNALCRAAINAVTRGCGVIILSDRGMNAGQAPIPSPLAVAAVHHHLIREGLRWRVSLVSETGEAREVSHLALLIAYGASAVHPYVALETVAAMARPEPASDKPHGTGAQQRYIKALGKGLLKIMSKMGISTLQSYCAAQLWEAVGLNAAFVDRHFAGTPSRVGGIGMTLIAEETLRRHAEAFDDAVDERLEQGGEYQYRVQGEHHNWNPLTIAKLQHATRGDNYGTFKEFSALANDETRRQSTLRGLLDFVERDPIPLDAVEPPSAITRRFSP